MEFAEFFTQMHWSVIVLLAAALIFFIVELIVPGFGVWGISGIVCGIAAVVCEAIFTKSLFDVFFMIFLVLVVFTIMFALFSFLFSRGFLKKTPLVDNETALPKDYGKDEKLQELIGKKGRITSICKPVGKAEIDGVTYTVCSKDSTIFVGDKIIVTEIKNNTIIVKFLGGENE